MKVLVIGSCTTDMIIKSPQLPVQGETITGTSHELIPGGRAINQAIAAVRAGAEVTVVSRIGNDSFGREILDVLVAENINTERITIDKTTPSGISSIVCNEKGKSFNTISPGANMNLSPEDIDKAKDDILSSDIILMQLGIPLSTVKYAAGIAKNAGKRIILNPSPVISLTDDILAMITVLTPDALEAGKLTGINITDDLSSELAGRILLERGLNRVIINISSKKGSMVIDNGGAEHVQGFTSEASDYNAANDTFNGVLAVELAEGRNIYEAVLIANAAISLCVSRDGGIKSIPYREEIHNYAKTLK